MWYERLPEKVFQSLEAKLEKAATNYEASLLLAAQLPQRMGLLLAWLMDLLVQVSMSSSINGTSVEMLGVRLSPVLCNGSATVEERLAKIAAMILQDKIDERLEREEMLAAAAFQQQMAAQQQAAHAQWEAEQEQLRAWGGQAAPMPGTEDLSQWMAGVDAAGGGGSGIDVSGWSKEDVAEWIASIEEGGADLAQRMLEEEIDGACLGAIERSDLARFGIATLGPQKKLLARIQELVG